MAFDFSNSRVAFGSKIGALSIPIVGAMALMGIDVSYRRIGLYFKTKIRFKLA
ncbi:hypothetical protein [Clostridium acidisoli]|uniref:hypothetical protein n=1 Tax=Clostridium acidisoli TaxID=91624 RepID=UPI001593C559|nr:hypothetical protein [Clostridium acidisoli]